MSATATTETFTLDVPGARLTYDVHGDLSTATDEAPVLFLIGSPMDSRGFETLRAHFTDRPVLTYDPRGIHRSVKDDPTSESTPEQHAGDLHAVIDSVGVGPVDLFASSGGAVNALALVAAHPDDVRRLVAHEPPTSEPLPDRETINRVCDDIHRSYQERGMGVATARFIALVMHRGELDASYLDQPDPDPAAFGLPVEDDGSRDDILVGQNIRTCSSYVPDYDAVKAAPTEVVVAVGEESQGEIAHRGGLGVAGRLGLEAVRFPSGHAGFLGGEFGQTGKPDEFAVALREALAR